jgi:uncharacterized protein YukJ
MPLARYGVLRAAVLDHQPATSASPHYQLLCAVGDARHRIAVNARSQVAPSEVEYAVVSPFAHPLADRAAALEDGWHPLATPGPDTGGLDLIRGNLCPPDQFRPLPISAPGADDDLNDLFDFHLGGLAGEASARVCAFGQAWGPDVRDPYFGFDPGQGVHDIHQNQGNVGSFTSDDGVWQDGGLLVHAGGAWTAILLRFQSQAWHTDDQTGHTVADTPVGGDEAPVVVCAAVVNPPGPAPEHESVLLLNRTYAPLELHGWTVATDAGSAALDGTVPAAGTLAFAMPATAPLSNKGGRISLLDPSGLKVHGVAYTAAQAAREDRLISF